MSNVTIKIGHWEATPIEAKPGRWRCTRLGSRFGEIIAWTQHLMIVPAAAWDNVAAYEFKELVSLIERVHAQDKKGELK